MAGKYPGVQAAYDRGGFKAVWHYVKGHGVKRWKKARNWARKRVKQARDPEGFKKARDEYRHKVRHLQQLHHSTVPDGKLIVMFDNRPVPAWIADILRRARASGIWHGMCISGVRTVQESIGLCRAMCGQDSCPGRCAGANTNHTCPPTHTCAKPEGAADCTDPFGLEAYCRSHNEPLIGDGVVLPADVNHFSHVGN